MVISAWRCCTRWLRLRVTVAGGGVKHGVASVRKCNRVHGVCGQGVYACKHLARSVVIESVFC
jgi:hypothetical protein